MDAGGVNLPGASSGSESTSNSSSPVLPFFQCGVPQSEGTAFFEGGVGAAAEQDAAEDTHNRVASPSFRWRPS